MAEPSPSTAEVVRDKPDAPPGATPPKPVGGREGLMKLYDDTMARIQPMYDRAEAAAKADLERRQKELADFRDKQAAQAPPPASPTLPDVPEAPILAARPFLNAGPGDTWQQSLQKLMLGAGLIGQMAMGLKGGFPEAGLAAYTGALTGWQEGDQLRAANEWKTYVGQLQQHDREVRTAQKSFDNAMQQYGANQDRLKTEFGLLAAEHGLSREGIELAFREPDRLMQNLTNSVKVMETMLRDADNVTFRNMMGLSQIEARAEAARHARAMEDLKRIEVERKGDDKLKYAQAGGAWYDKQAKVFLPVVTEGAVRESPDRFKNVAHTDMQMVEFIDSTARPQVRRLLEILPRLAAEHPGMNLYKAAELAGQGRLALSPDLREAVALNRDLMIEMTRALGGGGQLRITLLKALEKDVGWKTTDTIETGIRALKTAAVTLENRRRGMVGDTNLTIGSPEAEAVLEQEYGAPGGETRATPDNPLGLILK